MRIPTMIALFLLPLVAVPAWGEEGGALDPAARKARIAAARQKMAAEEADFSARVNKAIDRGIAWLSKQGRKDGGFPAFSEDGDPKTYNLMDVGLNALCHIGVVIQNPKRSASVEVALLVQGQAANTGEQIGLEGGITVNGLRGKSRITLWRVVLVQFGELSDDAFADGGPVFLGVIPFSYIVGEIFVVRIGFDKAEGAAYINIDGGF